MLFDLKICRENIELWAAGQKRRRKSNLLHRRSAHTEKIIADFHLADQFQATKTDLYAFQPYRKMPLGSR